MRTFIAQAIHKFSTSHSTLSFILLGITLHLNAATFVVTNTNDNGAGSLRQAILDANTTPGHDLITFDAGLGATPTITVNAQFNDITESVEIQGNTAVGGLVRIVGGTGQCFSVNMPTTLVNPMQTVFRGLEITNFPNRGINVTSGRNILVAGCRIGSATNPNQLGMFAQNAFEITVGTPSEPCDFSNNDDESLLFENVEDVVITNYTGYYSKKGLDFLECMNIDISNVNVGASTAEAIHLRRSGQISITESIIGLLPSGDFPPALGANTGITIGDGVKVEGSTDVTVGGVGTSRNVIGGTKNGVWIGGADNPLGGNRLVSNRVSIFGNYIGTDPTGLNARANTDHQVRIDDAQNVTVGGATPAEGNLISGAPNFYGVHIESQPWWSTVGASGIEIQNNTIGLDINGSALPNRTGILVGDPIGGGRLAPVVVRDNIIAGNSEYGIELRNSTIANVITGNSIGNNAGTPRPNGRSGIAILGASNNLIGGLGAGEPNVISNNGGNGIETSQFMGAFSMGNEIIGNTIHENSANGVLIRNFQSNNNNISQNSFNCNSLKAINLNNTPAQGIGNNNKRTPTISSSSSLGNLFGMSDPNDRIEIYERGTCQANGTCSADNYQMQGRLFVTSTTANGSGEWSFASTLAPANYTVIATSASGNTSEFAICACEDPTFTATKTDPSVCSGTDGSIRVSPVGNVTPLDPLATYSLTYLFNGTSRGPFTITTDASAEYVITALSSGTYSGITLSTSSCNTTLADQLVLSDPSEPTISSSSQNPSCGMIDGVITISGLTPSTSYEVNYNFNTGAVPMATLSSSAVGEIILNGLAGGAYTGITATLNGCTSNPEAQTLASSVSPTISTISSNPTVCNGSDGSITISNLASNTAGYSVSYELNGAAVPAFTRSSVGTEIVLTGLSAGIYTDIIVSLGGCPSNAESENLVAPTPVTISASGTNPSGCNLPDGSILISGLDASTNYELNYTRGSTPVSSMITSSTSSDFNLTGLSAENYSAIYVTESGCESNRVGAVLVDPNAPNITSNSSDVTSCGTPDGSIIISGMMPSSSFTLTYLENNRAPEKMANISSDASGTYTLTMLNAGSFSNIRVRSSSGCLSNATNETITEPLAPTFSVNSFDLTSCTSTDGRLELVGSGMNPISPNTSYNLSYQQNGSSVTLSPVSNASGTIIVDSLNEGNYTQVSLERDGCSTDNPGSFNLSRPQINGGSSFLTATEICHDEETELSISGASGNKIVWQDSISGNSWNNIADTLSTSQSNLVLSGINSSDGPYYYRALVFSDNGCEAISDLVALKVDTCPTIFVPEGISVNGDNQNDNWVILGLESYKDYTIKVFNRWGTVVYKADAPYDTPWDGTRNGENLPVATYYWHIRVVDTDEEFAGPITILR